MPAISETLPNLFKGTEFNATSLTRSSREEVISVSMKPGAIALTVTDLAANSRAKLLVNPIIPAFAAA